MPPTPSGLVQQIQRQRTCLSFTGQQLVPAAQNKGESRYTLDALVGAGYQEVDAPVGHRDIHTAERRHRVHNEGLSGIPHHFAYGLDIVEDTAGGFAVNHGHIVWDIM